MLTVGRCNYTLDRSCNTTHLSCFKRLPRPITYIYRLQTVLTSKMSEQMTRYDTTSNTDDHRLTGTHRCRPLHHQYNYCHPIVLEYHVNTGILTCVCDTIIGNARHTCTQSPIVVTPCSNSLPSLIRQPCNTCDNYWEVTPPPYSSPYNRGWSLY